MQCEAIDIGEMGHVIEEHMKEHQRDLSPIATEHSVSWGCQIHFEDTIILPELPYCTSRVI
jgi:hypothetical protein